MDSIVLTTNKINILNSLIAADNVRYTDKTDLNFCDKLFKSLSTDTKLFKFSKNSLQNELAFLGRYPTSYCYDIVIGCDEYYYMKIIVLKLYRFDNVKQFISINDNIFVNIKNTIKNDINNNNKHTSYTDIQIIKGLTVLQEIDRLVKIKINKRITADFKLNDHNENEFIALYGKTSLSCVVFENNGDIDTNKLFDNTKKIINFKPHIYKNFHIFIKYLNGEIYQASSYSIQYTDYSIRNDHQEFEDYHKKNLTTDSINFIKEVANVCCRVLYQNFSSTKSVCDFQSINYSCSYMIAKNIATNTYMLVTTIFDDVSCAGYHQTLTIKEFSTLNSLWENISNETKSVFLQYYIK